MANLSTLPAVRPVRAFADNYVWLIESARRPGHIVAVDPGDAAPVAQALRQSGASLAAVLLTHHHADHIGGVASLLELAPDAAVIGPDDARIPQRTRTVREGERCELPDLGLAFDILEIPGHTLSHVAFFGHGMLFCGDTLFSAGCGRMFEGTAPQMSASLDKLRALPADTRVFCGHEYTQANLKFALEVEPQNAASIAYRDRVEALRASETPSLPSTLALEIEVNPFLRCRVPAVRAAAERHTGRSLDAPAEVFGALRSWKDQFR